MFLFKEDLINQYFKNSETPIGELLEDASNTKTASLNPLESFTLPDLPVLPLSDTYSSLILESTKPSNVVVTKKKKKKNRVPINIANCKYDVVRKCAVEFGCRIVDDSNWYLFWIDTGVSIERVLEM